MCDPLTVLVQTANLTRALGEAIASVAAFINKVQHIDETTQALKEELSSLRRVVRAIESYLDSPEIEEYGKIPFLGDMETACKHVAPRWGLSQGLRSSNQTWLEGEHIGDIESAISITQLRNADHFTAHQLVSFLPPKPFSLLNISSHVVTNKPSRTVTNLNKRLDTLRATISEGQAHDNHIPLSAVACPILQSNKRLRDCATSMVSRASALGSVWLQTGSEFGQPLSAEDFRRTKAWISTTATKRLGPSDPKLTSSSTSTPQMDELLETLQIGPYNESLKSSVQDQDDAVARSDDGDDDFYPNKLKNYLEFGQQKLEADTTDEAEQAFRQALGLLRSLGQDRTQVDEIDILLKIAQTCLKQNKLEESESMCKLIASRLGSAHSLDSRALDASFILAQVFYRQGATDLALKECERCCKRRFKATGQSEAGFECIALLVTIYERQGNTVDACVTAKSLPPNYSFPVFNSLEESAASNTFLPQSRPTDGTHEDLLLYISDEEDSSKARKEHKNATNIDTKQLTGNRVSRIWKHNGSFPPMEPRPSGHAELSLQASRDSGVFTQMSDQSMNSKKLSLVSQNSLKGKASVGTLEEFFRAIENCQMEIVSAFLSGSIALKGSRLLAVFNNKGNDASLRKFATAVNRNGLDAVHLAAKLGHQCLLELFFKHKLIMNYNSDAWGTPLHLAAKSGHTSAVEFLLDIGANPNVVTATRDYTPLQQAARNGHDDVVKLLVQRGADVKFGHPHSALHLAAELGRMSSVKLLIEAGAPANSFDNNQRSALHYAARSGHHDVVSFLIKSGASLNVRDDENQRGMTPLDHAIRYGRIEIVRLLLEKGVDATSADSIGYTPLHLAAEHGRSQIVVMLIRHKVPLDCCDKKGNIPLQLANANKHYDIARLLTVPDDGRNERY